MSDRNLRAMFRWSDPARAGVLGLAVAAALATILPHARGIGASETAAEVAPAYLPGEWLTVANGDRVRSVLREDDTVWSMTEGGGVVRWTLSSGAHRQYLAPQDGLASNDVRAAARDRTGTLWVATADGLAFLDTDRDRWQPVRPDRPDLASPSATSLTVTPDGALWVGFEQRWDHDAPAEGLDGSGAFVGGGLARFDPTSRTWGPVVHAEITNDPDARPNGLPSENVTAVALGTDGLLWVGTRPYYRWSEEACGQPPCLPEEAAYVLDGGGLAATANLEAGWHHWNTINEICPASTAYVNVLAPDDDGRMWVGTRGRGLQLYMGGMTTRNCRPETGHIHYKPRRGGLPGSQVWDVDLDDEGRPWLAVGDGNRGLGVVVLDHGGTFEDPASAASDDQWTHVGLDGFTDAIDPVPSSLDEHDGEVVVGTRDDRAGDGWGVKRRDKTGAWRTLATADTGLPSNRITAIAANPGRGEVWFGTEGRGVARWNASTWRTWRAFARDEAPTALAVEGLRGAKAITLTMDAAAFNEAFPAPVRLARLGTDPVLYEVGSPWQIGDQVRVDVRPALPHGFPAGTLVHTVRRDLAGDLVTSIAFDRDGRTWVGTQRSEIRPAPPNGSDSRCETFPDCWYDGGVSVFDGEGWAHHNPKASDYSLPIRSVLALAVDTAGHVWAGTGDPTSDAGDGAAVYDTASDSWRVRSRRTEGEAFGGDVVTGVAVDPLTGHVWLATHHVRCEGLGPGVDCGPDNRIGGGISRFDGQGWTRWTKGEGSALTAHGTDGNFSSILFDEGRARVWAGAWNAASGFHWMRGVGIDAAANSCGRSCSDEGWASQVFADDGAVRALAADTDGRVWAGASRDRRGIIPHAGGVKLYDGAVWSRVSTDAWSPEVTALGSDGDGMWVGTYDGGAARYWPAELTPGAYLPKVTR